MLSLRRIFFRDLGTKALALVLALAIYVHVFSGQERELTYRVPLTVAPLPAGLALAGEYPDEARIRVRATGADLVKLSRRRPRAEVELAEPQEGNLQRPLLGSDVVFPHGIDPVQVEILEPRVLNLQIEPVTSALVPIAVRFEGVLAPSRAMPKPPETTPGTVRISGPQSVVGSVDSVQTEPFILPDTTGLHEQRAALRLPPSLTAEPESVLVATVTEERRVRRFGPIAVELLPAQEDGLLWVIPDSGAVIVIGADSIIERVNPNRIKLLADLRGRGWGAQRVELRAIVPGIPASAPIRMRCDPESVTVRLQ
jgi:hypothetical protein